MYKTDDILKTKVWLKIHTCFLLTQKSFIYIHRLALWAIGIFTNSSFTHYKRREVDSWLAHEQDGLTTRMRKSYLIQKKHHKEEWEEKADTLPNPTQC